MKKSEQKKEEARKDLIAVLKEVHARSAHIPDEEVLADVAKAIAEVRREKVGRAKLF